jgi:hypothetical protein
MAKIVAIQGDGYKLKGRIYGKADTNHSRPAILFLSGWNPGNQSWTTNDIHATYCAWKLNIRQVSHHNTCTLQRRLHTVINRSSKLLYDVKG